MVNIFYCILYKICFWFQWELINFFLPKIAQGRQMLCWRVTSVQLNSSTPPFCKAVLLVCTRCSVLTTGILN